MALIRARHAIFGVCRVGEAKVRLHPDEWTPLEPLPPLPAQEEEPADEPDTETAPEPDPEPEVQRPAVRRSRTTAAATTED